MARFEGQNRPVVDEGPLRSPWSALIVAWALIGAGIAAHTALKDHAPWLAVILTAAGVIATGAAVALRPMSALTLLLAGGTALLVSIVGDELQWDSARLALRVVGVVSIVAAGVVLLPTTARRIVVSLIILFHFGGIVTAVTSADGPWVAAQLSTYVYRPYLQFMYLMNAYHFYAPDPGPAPLLWFRVEYETDTDGSRNARWVKAPDTDTEGHRRRPDGTPLWPNVQYTRRLSLSESVSQPGIVAPLQMFLLTIFRDQEIADARLRYETTTDPTTWPLRAMPLTRELTLGVDQQYREPNDLGKKWVQSYVRHVARNYPHQQKPQLKVTSVKVYRVIHGILNAGLMQLGVPHNDPEMFEPYFLGEFDADGNMLPYNGVARLPDGTNVPVQRDPLLYWRIPIVRRQGMLSEEPGQFPKDYVQRKVTNYLNMHAGDEAEGAVP